MSASRGTERLGNRRAERRATLTAPVLVDTANAYHTGRCRDVSPDGLGLEIAGRIDAGAIVDLYFELPTGVALELSGQVVRSEGNTVGLRFNGLRAEDRRALAAYCEAWRGELLQRCARRAESMSDIRVDVAAPDAAAPTPYDAREPESGVRIRVAPVLDDARKR